MSEYRRYYIKGNGFHGKFTESSKPTLTTQFQTPVTLLLKLSETDL